MEIKLETITPEKAKSILQNNNANRPLNENHILFLAREMLAEQWMATPDTIKIGHHGNLLDGQHRLSALVESGNRLLISLEASLTTCAAPGLSPYSDLSSGCARAQKSTD